MDREYIVKHNLLEAHKQFMRLSEGYLATQLSEDDDEQPEDNNEMPGGEMGQAEPADNNFGNAELDNNPAGEEMTELDNEVPPMPEMEDIDVEEENDVIDVDDLTQAQEKLNKKQNNLGHDLGEVDDRIIALLTAVEKIQGSIEKNNNDITALKAELEKRVPTDTEKLNMQSLKMYPFNVSPNEYWEEKEKDGRYEAQEDDTKKKEYKLTQKDVDDYSDRDIENSFDEKLHQTMKDIFKGF